MELAFSFARRIINIGLADILLKDSPNERLMLSIEQRDLHTCNPLVGLYAVCSSHQRRRRVSNVAEYLYYSLMYKSPIPVGIHKYLADTTENDSILLRVRHLEVKHKSITSFVDRLYMIFAWPKFSATLRLEPISCFITDNVVSCCETAYITMRFNYLNRIATKLYTEPSTTIKILTYLLLLR
jgi:hypothetical protein